MAELRLKRIESLLLRELAAMIQRGEIKDPRVESLTTVTAVEVTKDLAHAKVWVSRFGERERLAGSVEALNHASGFIRSALAQRIPLRTFPRLRFVLDDSMERGFRIAQKLRDIGL
ncbi:MAG: ribosome-binding factor A [Spirochaetes bacterium RBG_13_68_11]|nr:MAG: ribosome-binding factor A [Spirochaetes bacterium RBG_13_68_11]